MGTRISRIVLGIISIMLIVSILLSITGFLIVRRSFPLVNGKLKIAGLQGPVDIYRDGFGTPHIYATTQHDLYFAQGFVHAQDRFWQMDFWRHLGSGRLSEMFGESQLETDIFLRRMGWRRVSEKELDALDDESLEILEAYAQGVNAYLADHRGVTVSLEYGILKLLNAGYQIESWQPIHSLTWAKAMAWDLGGNMDEEIERALLAKSLTPELIADITPEYPTRHPIILPDFQLGSGGFNHNIGQPALVSAMMADNPGLANGLQGIASQFNAIDELLGPGGVDIGSNSWVISGKLTDTGMPLLANDPHLGIQMPSIWYEIGLHCISNDADCQQNLAGFSFAGVPGIVIGHNARIAWGFTNVGPDVQDLFIEKVNPSNPNQYEVNGQWVDMGTVEETIQVAGGQPTALTVRTTRHGPVLWDTAEENQEIRDLWGVELPEHFAVAMRWTALEPTNTFPAIWRMNLAQNWDEFRAAASLFDVPSQNLVYADVDGNIGYQTPGKIPIRANGNGRWPAPGWTDEYEWLGYVPFEEMPYVFNPPQGYVTTANNAVIPTDYPYMISLDWDLGFRARRIVDMIEGTTGAIDIASIQGMQGDNKNLLAEGLTPILMQIPLTDERLQKARAILDGWDYQSQMDSAPAGLFNSFWKHLLSRAFHDDLPEDLWPNGGGRWWEATLILTQKPDSVWWDDKTTPETRENMEQIFQAAFADAVAELESKLGKDPQRWKWGDLHTATFRNASLGESGVAPIEALFNRGPFRASGGSSIVNATGWDAIFPYEVTSVPSMRMIVDLSNLSRSLTIHTTGQSGHAYHPHYIDMADLWRTIQYRSMLWERGQVEEAAEGHLELIP